MVRDTLSKPVQRMKRMARIRRRHNPLVVRLVQNFVHPRMMQTSVDPIYEEIGKGDKEWDLYIIVEGKGSVRRSVVEFCVATNFADEEGGGEDGHQRHGDQTLPDFKTNLVFEVFGVSKSGVVENEDIGKGCADEVDDEAKKPEKHVSMSLDATGPSPGRPCDKIQCQGLPPYVIPWPSTHVRIR